MADIAAVIRRAQLYTGAEHVMFLGGSAGGHAALRISAEFPGSLAFATDPQTDVGSYYAPHRSRLYRYCWPGWTESDILSSFPDRFNMLSLYSNVDPANFIYYRQSTGDEWHERVHAKPFELAIAGTTGVAEGRFKFVYERGVRDGHGKITADEFSRHFDDALAFWRGGSRDIQ